MILYPILRPEEQTLEYTFGVRILICKISEFIF